MCRRIVFTLLVSLSSSHILAQADSIRSGPGWFASIHSGALFARAGKLPSATMMLMQGIRYNRFSLGVGVGYDTYENWQTVPVFTGVGYDVIRRGRNAIYLQVNGGYSKAWNTFPDEQSSILKDDGGYFAHPMIGYRFHEGRIAVYFSAGYKIQRLHYTQNGFGWGWGWSWTAPKTTVIRDMERVSIQMGIGIN